MPEMREHDIIQMNSQILNISVAVRGKDSDNKVFTIYSFYPRCILNSKARQPHRRMPFLNIKGLYLLLISKSSFRNLNRQDFIN